MKPISIYQYQSAREFMLDYVAEQKRSNPEFSIRRFAKSSGFGSHALLVMILKGKRNLILKHVPALAEGLKLESAERVFLQTLIQLDHAKNEEEKNLYRLWLNDLNPKREYRILEAEHYHLIANWVHMAILTLAKIDGAKLTPENIYELIRHKVSLSEVRQAVERLLDLGMLVEKDGMIAPTFHSVKTRDDISNKGAREYHRQVSRLAVDSLEEQEPSIREFQSFALTVPEGKIPLAKELIRKFRHQLVQVLEAEPGHEVYQCNLQFFKLAESPSTLLKPTVDESARKSGESSKPKINHEKNLEN